MVAPQLVSQLVPAHETDANRFRSPYFLNNYLHGQCPCSSMHHSLGPRISRPNLTTLSPDLRICITEELATSETVKPQMEVIDEPFNTPSASIIPMDASLAFRLSAIPDRTLVRPLPLDSLLCSFLIWTPKPAPSSSTPSLKSCPKSISNKWSRTKYFTAFKNQTSKDEVTRAVTSGDSGWWFEGILYLGTQDSPNDGVSSP